MASPPSFITTFISDAGFLTDISMDSIPRKEKVSSHGNDAVFIEKLPSVSDMLPFFVPFIITFTPASGTPYSSSIDPEIKLD